MKAMVGAMSMVVTTGTDSFRFNAHAFEARIDGGDYDLM